MTAPKERRASPAEARSVAALFLAAGAQPDEIDGAVNTLIKLSEKQTMPPTTYAEIAQQAIDALQQYRQEQSPSVVESSQ